MKGIKSGILLFFLFTAGIVYPDLIRAQQQGKPDKTELKAATFDIDVTPSGREQACLRYRNQ